MIKSEATSQLTDTKIDQYDSVRNVLSNKDLANRGNLYSLTFDDKNKPFSCYRNRLKLNITAAQLVLDENNRIIELIGINGHKVFKTGINYQEDKFILFKQEPGLLSFQATVS